MGDVTLTEFLLARIAEDELVAMCDITNPERLVSLRSAVRARADCEAKRRIVARHWPEEFADAPGEFCCARCQRTAGVWPCPDVKDLALPYADHPDYRQEWRP